MSASRRVPSTDPILATAAHIARCERPLPARSSLQNDAAEIGRSKLLGSRPNLSSGRIEQVDVVLPERFCEQRVQCPRDAPEDLTLGRIHETEMIETEVLVLLPVDPLEEHERIGVRHPQQDGVAVSGRVHERILPKPRSPRLPDRQHRTTRRETIRQICTAADERNGGR
jgi:hypothetical protein